MTTEYLLLQAVSLIIIKLHHFFNVNNKSKYYSSGVNLDCGNKVESSDTTSPASMIHREEHLARLKFQQYLQYGKTTLHI